MSAFLDSDEDMHPMNCHGPNNCVHCDRRIVVYTGDEGTSHFAHHPATCVLCDPAYDHMPNPHWKGARAS